MRNYYYYEVLGVDIDAPQEEIKKAYKEMMKKYHPDAHPENNTEYYETKAKIINEAYDVLGNSEKRKNYDIDCAIKEAEEERKKQQQKNERARQQQARTTHNSSRNRYNKGQPINKKPKTDKKEKNDNKKDGSFFGDVKQAYREIKEEESKHKIGKRHKKINKFYHGVFDKKVNGTVSGILFYTGQGVVHVSTEMLFQLSKLKYVTKDSVVKYVIRNRFLLAATAATAGIIIISNIINSGDTSLESNPKNYLAGERTEATQSAKKNIITLMRKYTVEPGDSLSSLSDMSLTKIKTIKKVNNLKSDTLYLGDTILLPYEVLEDNLQYYVKIVDSNGMSIKDLADIYSTDVDTLSRLNKDAIATVNGVKVILSEKIIVPSFITSKDLEEIKEAVKIKTY